MAYRGSPSVSRALELLRIVFQARVIRPRGAGRIDGTGEPRHVARLQRPFGLGQQPPRHVALTWAARLKRVFAIDIERCVRCGGRLKVLASIEEPALIARILAHRRERGQEDSPVASLGPRAPPGSSGLLF